MKIKLPDNERAVWLLKTNGPMVLADLAKEMKITTEGARFQLLKLANDGHVKFSTESKGRGRPQQTWSLTALGHSRFPDTHAELTVKLIDMTRQVLGEPALDAIILAKAKESQDKYSKAMEGVLELESRVRILTEFRDGEGYMAEYIKEDQDSLLLIENHCPICSAATACQQFCKYELETFRNVLGDNVDVHRISHLLQGERRCAYRISKKPEHTTATLPLTVE